MILKTVEGKPIKPGMTVYYVSTTQLGEPIICHTVTSIQTFKQPNNYTLSIENERPMHNKVFTRLSGARLYKSYVNKKRTEQRMALYNINKPLNYNPNKEV